MPEFTTYFIADTHGSVKIGYSGNIPARLVTLQAAHAHELTLIGATEIPETTAHRKWGRVRLRGEWFRLTPELREWITSVSREWVECQQAQAARNTIRGKRRRQEQAAERDSQDEARAKAKAATVKREAACLRDFIRRNPLND